MAYQLSAAAVCRVSVAVKAPCSKMRRMIGWLSSIRPAVAGMARAKTMTSEEMQVCLRLARSLSAAWRASTGITAMDRATPNRPMGSCTRRKA